VFGCIQSLRNHLRGVNTGLNFNSISLKNHKGNIIIWIVKFFLEIGSITGCCSCCWIRPFCGDEYGLIDHWSGIFSYKNMSITVQLQFDSWSKNSWIKNMILLMQGCRCFCCYSNPVDFEAFFFLSFCIEEFVDTRQPRTWSLLVHFVFLLVGSIEYFRFKWWHALCCSIGIPYLTCAIEFPMMKWVEPKINLMVFNVGLIRA